MIAYWYRFIDDDGEPTGWIGLAIGENRQAIFDSIDEFGDPYCCEVQRAHYGGYCRQVEVVKFKDGDVDLFEYENISYQMSGAEPFLNDSDWKKIDWRKVLKW